MSVYNLFFDLLTKKATELDIQKMYFISEYLW